MTTLAELRALADKATPGPWGAWVEGHRHPFKAELAWGGDPLVLAQTSTTTTTMLAAEVSEEDAHYIAACSPEVVKALVAVAEAAETQRSSNDALCTRWDCCSTCGEGGPCCAETDGERAIRAALDALKAVLG